jgi:hypothetical protein
LGTDNLFIPVGCASKKLMLGRFRFDSKFSAPKGQKYEGRRGFSKQKVKRVQKLIFVSQKQHY